MVVISLIKQQTLLIVLFCVIVGINIYLFGRTLSNSSDLTDSREISQHSDEVADTIRETNQLHKEADLCGRLALNGINHCNSAEKRQMAFKSVEQLRSLVSDSQVQTENVNNLFNAIQKRYSTQDSVKNIGLETGQLILPVEKSLELTETSIQVERMFNNLEAQEFSYLKQRHQRLSEIEYFYNRSVSISAGSLFIGLCVFGWFAHRFLSRNKRAEKKLELEKLENVKIVGPDEIVMKRVEYETARKILRGEAELTS